MLIVSRRVDESIFIGDNIVVTVLGMHSNQVRIGIRAPAEVEVRREEVYWRNKLEAATATSAAPPQVKQR